MELHESGEMYLETILMLKKKKGYVKSIDIASALNYSKPSVSRAMKLLKESELIVMDSKGHIELTQKGQKIAEKVYSFHTTFTDFFTFIGVSREQAEEDACRVEHIISDETYQCLIKFMQKQS